MAEKYIEKLDKAASGLKTADHMLYMTYPLVKEKRLLLKILNEVYSVIINIINSILQYEYLYKRIRLYKDSKSNLEVFKQKCASRYKITPQQITRIFEIFKLTEKHKKSPFEFVRNNKIVIMSNTLKTDTITADKLKEYILVTKDLLRKAETIIRTKH
jgi:hypothetical protein